MEPNYYAIIPADIRYNKSLKSSAKLMYGEITALCNRDGYCWAGNEYFADLYQVSKETVSRWISQLEEFGYIGVLLMKSEGNKRKITIDKKINSYRQKDQDLLIKKSRPIDEKINSIEDNITINNTINREGKALAFLEQDSPSEYENFLMRFKKEFKEKEFEKFKELFDCKVEEEGLEYTTKIISNRLIRFAINYLDKLQNQFEMKKETTEPVPAYLKNIILK